MKAILLMTVVMMWIHLPSISQAQEKQQTYMLAFLTPKDNEQLSAEEIQVLENDHLRNIGKLSESGVLANAGPFEGGGELMLLNTSTRNDTEDLLLKDPAVQNGLFKIEILSMEFRRGGICNPDVPYEIKPFSFVRYLPTNQIASYKTNADFDMRRTHQNHIDHLSATGNVLVEGVFPGNDGGILIYKGNSLDDKISDDPAIKQGYLKAELKTIWLNKGSFCDQ